MRWRRSGPASAKRSSGTASPVWSAWLTSTGSVPRETGARIVLQPDGGFFGTIGGGRLEYEAIAVARAALVGGARRAPRFRDWPLGPNLGQCCGGMVRTLTETFDARDSATVWRFAEAEQSGAFVTFSRVADDGRIARVLGPRARPVANSAAASASSTKDRLPRTVRRGDHAGAACSVPVMSAAPSCCRSGAAAVRGALDRQPAGSVSAATFRQNVVTVRTDDAERELAEAPRDAMVVVMTHSHPLDFDITAAALRRGRSTSSG